MSEKEKQEMLEFFENKGHDIRFLIRESFLGYKYRKQVGKLYDSDSEIPDKLIASYYGLNPDEASFDTMKKAFVTHYIRNESEIEGISDIHDKEEIEGLAAMYDYIHSDEVNYMFDVYTLKELHAKLFSFAQHPEFGGDFRTFDVFLPGTGTELSSWYNIHRDLEEIDKEVQKLVAAAPLIRAHDSMESLFAYIDRCIEVKCRLIKVHPFSDGNGRTIRGFTNKLFEDIGLPPVYIKANERTEYHKAMNLANNDNDYSAIKNFYRYKICDSIIELDINERTKRKTEKTIKGPKIKK